MYILHIHCTMYVHNYVITIVSMPTICDPFWEAILNWRGHWGGMNGICST